MSNIFSTAISFGKVFLLTGVLAAFPLAAMAEGTDLQQGSQGSIQRPAGKMEQPAPHGDTPYVAPQPDKEGTDLETGSKGDIKPAKSESAKPYEGSASPVPQQNPGMEGTDLQKGSQNSINK